MNWYDIDAAEAVRILKSNARSGLPSGEARRRLLSERNTIKGGRQKPVISLFLAQFKDTMVLVLLGATLLSGLLGDIVDAVTILTIVMLNGILGFVQEYRAEKSLEEIKKYSSASALVVRDGKKTRINAEELVPGDILFLEAGDRVPADVRIIETFNLEAEESCLTGESLPVKKKAETLIDSGVSLGDRANMCFLGTSLTRGRAMGVVTATGMKTEMGRIAALIQEAGAEPTPLQRRLDHLGKVLIVVCLAACSLVALLGIVRGENPIRMLMAGITLAVAAVPEGLPAVVTVVLAAGVQRMAGRRAVVRKLPAVETLGCTNVICSDKTGTLTRNQMTVRCIATMDREFDVTGEGFDPIGEFRNERGQVDPLDDQAVREMLEAALYCNNASLDRVKGIWSIQGDPTEGALLVLAYKAGLKSRTRKLRREIPFESERRMMSVVIENGKGLQVMSKGALQSILAKCDRVLVGGREETLDEAARAAITRREEEWAGQAFRVLAFARRNLPSGREPARDEDFESELCLLGICGMIDPPRPAAVAAVKECLGAGMVPVMITGDHPATALAIAGQMGISSGEKAISGPEVETMTPGELAKQALQCRVFARVSPQHKLSIVKALKSEGYVVAMTGDGVNDAPAVKEADIGVAMGISGTEVTREASCMVLMDDDFSTIVAAVHEGRTIYDNIRKFIRYLLGCNVGEVLTMFLASLGGMPLPLLPIQILWVNLVTDGLPAMALGMEHPEPGVMNRPPRRSDESVFSRGLGWHIAGRGIFIGVSTLLVLALGLVLSSLEGNRDLGLARTMALTSLVVSQLFYVFECRSERYSPFEIGFFSNRFLTLAAIISIAMQLLVVYYPPLSKIFHTVPLEPLHWALIILVGGSGLLWQAGASRLRKHVVNQNRYGKLDNVGVAAK